MLLQVSPICSYYIHFVSLRRHHIHIILQNNEAVDWFVTFQADRYLLSILTLQIDHLHMLGHATDWVGQFSAKRSGGWFRVRLCQCRSTVSSQKIHQQHPPWARIACPPMASNASSSGWWTNCWSALGPGQSSQRASPYLLPVSTTASGNGYSATGVGCREALLRHLP